MAQKRLSLNARLQRALRIRKMAQFGRPYFQLRKQLAELQSLEYRRRPFATGLSGPSRDDVQKATASEALWLTKEAFRLTKEDATIKKAFDTFDLDPNDPWQWRELVEELVSIVFERKEAGRRKEWTAERKLELLRAVDAKRRNTRLSDEQACKHLAGAKDSPPYFRKAGTEGLLKQLQFVRAETGRPSTRRSKRSN